MERKNKKDNINRIGKRKSKKRNDGRFDIKLFIVIIFIIIFSIFTIWQSFKMASVFGTASKNILDDFINNRDKDTSYYLSQVVGPKTEKIVLKDKIKGIKDSDGAGCETSLVIKAIANSNGFVGTRARTFNYLGLTLLGDDGIKMQRGSGYSTSLDFAQLKDPEAVAKEAVDRTLEKLNAKKITTGTYNVIFSKGAMMSLWGHLLSAISGGSMYRKTTFLHDSLNKEVLPEFISLHEDPFIVGGLASGNFDGEGVQARVSDIVDKGVLKEFLLSSYTARKLNLKTNGHSGSVYNLCVVSEKDPVSLDEMMKEAGSGIVITDLMGQGVDLLTGNYSRGAAGFYFENGERKHAVEEITVAGNLKDMFKNIALVGNDYDDRFKIKSGSLLIPDMTISGI